MRENLSADVKISAVFIDTVMVVVKNVLPSSLCVLIVCALFLTAFALSIVEMK